MATPSPLRTCGISVTPTYLRRPGVETRRSSRITGCPPCAYLRTTRSIWRPLSFGTARKSWMKLFSFSRRAISSFSLDMGMSTRRCFDPQALRIRVNMSETGSVMLIRSTLVPAVSLPGPAGCNGVCHSSLRATSRRLSAHGVELPARFPHPWNEAAEGHLPEGDSRQSELLEVAARPSGHRAPVADALLGRVAGELLEAGLRRLLLLHRRLRILDDRLE